MWDRFSPAARAVMNAALDAADELGHGYIGDEHVLLGLLGRDAGSARQFLHEHGLEQMAVKAELVRLQADGHLPRSHVDDAARLREVGIDVDRLRSQLSATFGQDAVAEAVWRASRKPWWRGGGRRSTPLCGKPLFAKRALSLAAQFADGRGQREVAPQHLLYGVLQDAADPFGTGLSRRGRRHLGQLGWSLGANNPAAAVLAAHGLDADRLRAQLSAEIDSSP
jgi:ATP-dependent Clp protease ATP-binding subunit ClpA